MIGAAEHGECWTRKDGIDDRRLVERGAAAQRARRAGGCRATNPTSHRTIISHAKHRQMRTKRGLAKLGMIAD